MSTQGGVSGRQAPSVMLLMEDYRGSYTTAYEGDPILRSVPYDQMTRALFARSIYYGDSFLEAFRRENVDASQHVPASRPLQYHWARENAVQIPRGILAYRPFRWWWTRRGREHPKHRVMREIVLEQVRRYEPDVLWVFSGVPMTEDDVRTWRRHTRKLALWWSCALEPNVPYGSFDLILSASRDLVRRFRDTGLPAEHMAHAFDPRILGRVSPRAQRIPRVAFVGSLGAAHGERTKFLDALSRNVPVDFYGPGIELTPADSPLRQTARPPVWGDDLYRVYGSYAVVVHTNADFAAASSKRLFEATGMGACVLTRRHPDLNELFDPDVEVATYDAIDDAVAAAKRLLSDRKALQRIGDAGQLRTLRDHSFSPRVIDFLRLIGERPAVEPQSP